MAGNEYQNVLSVFAKYLRPFMRNTSEPTRFVGSMTSSDTVEKHVRYCPAL